jgi:hypothetical protein
MGTPDDPRVTKSKARYREWAATQL